MLDDRGKLIRTFEVCNVNQNPRIQDNWLATPFLLRHSAPRVFVSLRFSVRDCASLGSPSPTCRETLTLYYKQADSQRELERTWAAEVRRSTRCIYIACKYNKSFLTLLWGTSGTYGFIYITDSQREMWTRRCAIKGKLWTSCSLYIQIISVQQNLFPRYLLHQKNSESIYSPIDGLLALLSNFQTSHHLMTRSNCIIILIIVGLVKKSCREWNTGVKQTCWALWFTKC